MGRAFKEQETIVIEPNRCINFSNLFLE